MINAIVCTDSKKAIGKDNKLLFNLPKDMQFFKDSTAGKIVVCGRKTLESFPGGKPLKGRSTICICSEENKRDDCYCVHSFNEALKLVQELSKTQDVWIIGGQTVYEAFLPYYDLVWLTEVNTDVDGDTFFPDIDALDNFKLVWISEPIEDNGYTIKFCQYERVN